VNKENRKRAYPYGPLAPAGDIPTENEIIADCRRVMRDAYAPHEEREAALDFLKERGLGY
jgi:hypothetical protein